MDKKRAFLLETTGFKSEDVFILILGNPTPVLAGGLWSAYYCQVHLDHIDCYKVKSTGFFKKTYTLESNHQLHFKDVQKAEFGSGNGNLWLTLNLKQGDIVFTSGGDWTSSAGQQFVQNLSQFVSIEDLGLYTKKIK
ncbi:hypothetical protein KTG15_12525 [Methanobacterium sp. YSL]|nr:hypothetical protein [Methanobacterium sp. YSL]